MRVLFLLLIITAVVNISVNAATDYEAKAASLLQDVLSTISDLDKADAKIRDILLNLNQTLNSVDFGLSQNQKILELQAILEKHKLQTGIVTCVNLKNDKVEAVKQSLRAYINQVVDKQLSASRADLFRTYLVLKKIVANLRGYNLSLEIELCTKTPTCKITIDYPLEVKSDARLIHYLEKIALTLVNGVIKSTTSDLLPGKIDNEIYKPVNECIQHVNIN